MRQKAPDAQLTLVAEAGYAARVLQAHAGIAIGCRISRHVQPERRKWVTATIQVRCRYPKAKTTPKLSGQTFRQEVSTGAIDYGAKFHMLGNQGMSYLVVVPQRTTRWRRLKQVHQVNGQRLAL